MRGFDSPELLIPTSGRVREKLRADAFKQLMVQVKRRAIKEKAKLNHEPEMLTTLTAQETKDLEEATRARLEAIGWWKSGGGLR